MDWSDVFIFAVSATMVFLLAGLYREQKRVGWYRLHMTAAAGLLLAAGVMAWRLV